MHGFMKAKRTNVSETRIGTILGEMNLEAQKKRGKTLSATCEIHRSTTLNTFVTIFIKIRMRNLECLVGVAHV